MPDRLILASASAARAALLHAAGLVFAVVPANIDEGAAKRAARAEARSAIAAAQMLATEKAVAVSRSEADAVVIGADQILAIDGEWFDKPRDLTEARAQLTALRGRTHMLATGVCVARRGQGLWTAASAPRLTMRHFSDAFLDAYLAAEGESLLAAVGAYRLEGRGVQLFAGINGDCFAVLGLPLLELLGFLRDRGVVPG